MTFRHQYRSARRKAIIYMVLSLVCLPAISAADYFFGAKLNEWAYALTEVAGIFFWVMACVKFDEMRKAKRYIVFDTFLNEIN